MPWTYQNVKVISFYCHQAISQRVFFYFINPLTFCLIAHSRIYFLPVSPISPYPKLYTPYQSHHDGFSLQNVESIAQSAEIPGFFNVLGPALLKAALASLSLEPSTMILGFGCNHARCRSPVAAFLTAQCLKQNAAPVAVNTRHMTRACLCFDCRRMTDQPGMKDAF